MCCANIFFRLIGVLCLLLSLYNVRGLFVDCQWVVSGLCVGCERGLCERVVCGLSVGCAWVVRGLCVGCAWVVRGLCVGCAWVVRGLCVGCAWVVRGLCVGCACVVRGLCVGCSWVVHARWRHVKFTILGEKRGRGEFPRWHFFSHF